MSEGPGLATISDLMRHWNVCWKVAEAIADHFEDKRGLERALTKKYGKIKTREQRWYRWEDIWEMEGRVDVPPKHWSRMKERLLTVTELASRDNKGRSARTFRRDAANGTLPSVKLPIGKHLFREFEVELDLQ
ncbi:hypothetical protein FDK21_11740 [Cohaesibacter sp. CAU 1516]|uniref:hypothetical protein n=1 Tax=Cohaesibacter sp. CAU 1516 TaxID=2576038 RepID=UPI0010FD5D82|nr:hypothetical protein [Cohaesibacter sp. CAU 1516]TLP45428.1 hypothetical protein FDK21_11740 [Cohaesibacter sp. CAU 1516]